MKNDSKNFGKDFSYEDLVSVLGSALSDFSERIDYKEIAEELCSRVDDGIDNIQHTLCSLFYEFLKEWTPSSSIVSIKEDGQEYELSFYMALKILKSVTTLNSTKATKLIYRVVGHEDVFDDMLKKLRRMIKEYAVNFDLSYFAS